jgi:hypothetical protein
MTMERARSTRPTFFVSVRLGLCLVLATALFLLGQPAKAQEDYPVPPGNPESWSVPGQSETLLPGRPSPLPSDPFTALRRPGNENQNLPNTPSGEAQEEYMGTGQFGGIAGTGITPFGTTNR